MYKVCSVVTSLFIISSSVCAAELDDFLTPEVRGLGLLNGRNAINEASLDTRDCALSPIGYQYVTVDGVYGHIHTYSDCMVVTVATGPTEGFQAIYDLSGTVIASKTRRDGTQAFYGTTYDLYHYGDVTLLHAGRTQLAYIYHSTSGVDQGQIPILP